MKSRHTLHALTVCASLLAAATAHGRGGETGTLDKEPSDPSLNVAEWGRSPMKPWSPFYLGHDHFRRLRARLSLQPLAPIPGWDKQKAWRYEDRYFSEDGAFEILPLMNDDIR